MHHRRRPRRWLDDSIGGRAKGSKRVGCTVATEMGCSTVRGDAVVRLLAAAFVACWVAGCGSAQSSASSAPASNGPVTTAAAIGSAPVASEAPPQTLTRIPVQHVVAGPFALDAPGAWHVGPPTYL